MMNFILGKLAGNKVVAGLLAVQAFLSGKKSIIAGSILILQAMSGIIGQVEGINGLGDLLELIKNIGTNDDVTKFAEGLGIVGIRLGIKKGLES